MSEDDDRQVAVDAEGLSNVEASPFWPLLMALAGIAERVERQQAEAHHDKLESDVRKTPERFGGVIATTPEAHKECHMLSPTQENIHSAPQHTIEAAG